MIKQSLDQFFLDIGDHNALECHAPCTVYSVLAQHGIISDPCVGTGILDVEKYSGLDCCFTTYLDVTPLILSMKNVFIRFYGLDARCRILVNGSEVGVADNAHRLFTYDVKTKLTIGMNRIELRFDSSAHKEQGIECARRASYLLGNAQTPRLMDAGIFRKAELIAFNHKIISNVKVKQIHTENSVRLDIKLNTVGYDELSRAVATLTSPAGNVYFCGFVEGEGTITIGDPNLWWPNGLGIQNLYRMNLNLYSDSEIEDSYEMHVGLRTISLDTDGEGRRVVLINGERMFPMGGEYVPEDILPAGISEQRTRELLQSAKDANFNSILIHGSGYYPEDYFLDICDELGILVWQHIPISTSGAPIEGEYAESIKREMTENLHRIVHHPSLGVIIGNRRVSDIFESKDAIDKFVSGFSDFDGMNVFDIDGTLESSIMRINAPSVPTYDSMMRFLPEGMRNLGSRAFEVHGATRDTVLHLLDNTHENYLYANNLSELAYTVGLDSADRASSIVDDVRSGKTRPLGVFISTMNESWPTISSSIVDYYGVKKPLHYSSRRFFSPLRIMMQKQNSRVKFIVTNDTKYDIGAVFSFAIMDNKNKPIFRDSFPIRARAASTMEVHGVDLGSIVKGHEEEYYVLYSVTDNAREPSVCTQLFTTIKRFEFLKPNYSVEILGTGTDFTASISADCFVKGVEVSFDDVEVDIANNYFDITGKGAVKVAFTTSRIITVEKLKRVIKLRSVYDLGKE